MIISDLSHFEEVVAEAPTIVGGTDNTIFIQLPSYIFNQQLSSQIRNLLKSFRGHLTTFSVTNENGFVSVTAGVVNQGISIAVASSVTSSS